MEHRSLAVVVVTALVVLAGCSALAPGGSDGNETTAGSPTTALEPTDAQTGPEATPSATDPTTARTTDAETQTASGETRTAGGDTPMADTAVAAGNGTQSSDGFPPGYGASGVTNPQRAVAGFSAALLSHDSYTLAATIPTTRPSANVSLVSRTNLSDERTYQVANGTLSGRQVLRQEVYQNETMRYTASFPPSLNDTPEYSATTRPFAPTATASTSGLLVAWLDNATFGSAERVTRDGETLVRYEATGLRSPDPFLSTAASADNVSVNDFAATLLVDREGIVRSFEYSATYTSRDERSTTTGRLRVSDIDATTVPEPAWLDEARAGANASGAPGGAETAGAVAG